MKLKFGLISQSEGQTNMPICFAKFKSRMDGRTDEFNDLLNKHLRYLDGSFCHGSEWGLGSAFDTPFTRFCAKFILCDMDFGPLYDGLINHS